MSKEETIKQEAKPKAPKKAPAKQPKKEAAPAKEEVKKESEEVKTAPETPEKTDKVEEAKEKPEEKAKEAPEAEPTHYWLKGSEKITEDELRRRMKAKGASEKSIEHTISMSKATVNRYADPRIGYIKYVSGE